MKKTLLTAAVLLSLGTAHADTTYVGFSLGNCRNEADFPAPGAHGADNETSQCFGLTAGKRTSWGAFQASYEHFGTFWIRNTTDESIATIQAVGVDAVYDLGPVFVKGGIESWEMVMTFNGDPLNKTGVGLRYGLGTEINFNTNSKIRIGYDVHASVFEKNFNDKPGVRVLYVGILIETK